MMFVSEEKLKAIVAEQIEEHVKPELEKIIDWCDELQGSISDCGVSAGEESCEEDLEILDSRMEMIEGRLARLDDELLALCKHLNLYFTCTPEQIEVASIPSECLPTRKRGK